MIFFDRRLYGSAAVSTWRAADAASLQYLSEVMPVDHLFLALYDRGLGAVRTVLPRSRFTMEREEEYPLIPLSVEARKILENPGSLNTIFKDRPDLDSVMVRIINDPTHDPITGPIFVLSGTMDSSLLAHASRC